MKLDPDKLPRHIAIIMDGNGRWARSQNLPRIEGHRRGSETVEEIVEACREIGIPYLTLYAFSMENWARPTEEIHALMALLKEFLVIKRNKLIQNGTRLETIGDLARLPEDVVREIDETKRQTASCSEMTLVLALSYGARDEIVRAVNGALKDAQAGRLEAGQLSETQFAQYLDTRHLPDPDLLIRTSGESRTSNFLQWQTAYAEIIFTDTLWPDFHKENLIKTLEQYAQRERRFGQTSDQVQER
jgi:undecaprenyl diphosphate synthase